MSDEMRVEKTKIESARRERGEKRTKCDQRMITTQGVVICK